MAQDYKVITYQDSAELQHLMFSQVGSGRRTYYETKMKEDPSALYVSELEMIPVILEEPKTLMWSPGLVAAGDERLKALNILDSVQLPGAYAYQKGSEFRRMFDYHLLRIKESGIRERIGTIYAPEPPLKIGVDEANQLGFDVLLFPAMVLSCGGFGGLLIMVFEFVLGKCGLGPNKDVRLGTLGPRRVRRARQLEKCPKCGW